MTHVLILDDNADITALLRTALERGGYQVLTGRNGQEGINLLYQAVSRPDAIICNLLMPLMDGFTFLDKLRQKDEWLTIPVIMLTALTSDDTRQAAFEHGANAFVPKPFRLADLNLLLRNLGVSPN